MNDDLQIRDNVDERRFEVELSDGSFALAEYRLGDGTIAFTHTVVPEEHEGQGIGTALIRFALASARERGLKVLPACPFFAAYMKKHADVQDLLDPSYRARLGLD